jgi:hypothetical protein
MHSIFKLVAKILVNVLSPHLDRLISHSQSAFIKDRYIQDNFQYVQGVVNHFHQSKIPMILLKLDITKAFDNVSWEYLLETMEHVGFGPRWRHMMALIWASSTSGILLNVELSKPLKHARGLRQGGPLLPMLFILAMDPRQKLLDMATQEGLLNSIRTYPIKMRTSLYADDAMLFLRPIAPDVSNLQQLLTQFGMATGLCTNIQKSKIYQFGEGVNIIEVLGNFQVRHGHFPCKYLGLSLRNGKIKREDERLLIDKVTGKLPRWKGKLLNKTCRLIHINYVLSIAVLYHMMVFPLSKWAIKKINKI